MSLESRHGWFDLYLSLGCWPDRILEARRNGTRDRDELDYFMHFFIQCQSLRDWALAGIPVDKAEISMAMKSYNCMLFCCDISNRYKHLKLGRKIYFDENWSVWADHERPDSPLMITARDQDWHLWDLMVECLSFWEAFAAYYGPDGDAPTYRPA